MNARATRRKGNPSLAATGVRIVATDHQMTPNAKTCFPPTVSAHIPPAICNKSELEGIPKRKKIVLNLQWLGSSCTLPT
ncbi:unnamed protein product [Trifolium pratense]|uniref:Uncharacterized protein n=1 Tax=Trifolium pratense TaxID=57577 RepID=A0ACB0J985_TRIPR|nr:unnamed protein product [Trifolium pratense]